jgi:membrane dipeptidase
MQKAGLPVTTELSPEALELHSRSLIIDGCVVGPSTARTLDNLEAGGVNAGNWTVSGHADTCLTAMLKMEERRWLVEREPKRTVVALTAADIEQAWREGRFACVMGFQGASHLGHNFHFLAIFWRLGLRVLQLTYNERNDLGDGCLEPENRGLTHSGIQIVRDCNRLGVLLDLSHGGHRTCLDIVEHSSDPVTISHTGVYTLQPNPRNARDDLTKAVAARGGVVGLAAFSDFVADTRHGHWPTLDDYLKQIDYIANLVGIEHTAIGTDMLEATAGVVWDNNTLRQYPEVCGEMTIERHQIEGFPNHSAIPKITDGLLRRGYAPADVQKIMGQNLLQLCRQVWRD